MSASYGVISVPEVVDVITELTGVTSREVMSRAKTAKVVGARHLAMFLARELTGLSFPQLGRAFKLDQSTVQHGVNKVEGMLIDGHAETHIVISRARERLVDPERRIDEASIRTWLMGLTRTARDAISDHDVSVLLRMLVAVRDTNAQEVEDGAGDPASGDAVERGCGADSGTRTSGDPHAEG